MGAMSNDATNRPKLVKPRSLKPGDSVAIASPGAHLTEEGRSHLKQAVSALERMGYRVKAAPGSSRRKYYFAGSDHERAEELMALFADDEVRAILCARGGYGSQRIVPLLDSRVIRRNPKLFVGSSDITVLLVYLMEACHIVPFHGPNVATEQFVGGALHRTQAGLSGALDRGIPAEVPVCRSLKPGIRRGKLKGGCLSLLVTTIGTPYEIDLEGAILFIEDLNEPPYRIDRMLTHMRQAGKLGGLGGLVLGEMGACQGQDGVDLDVVILDLFQDQEVPIIAGFPSGHGKVNLTIPLGVDVTLDANRGILIFNETGVSTP
jgi:muramoyltetrapeptide carboxypeptidase